MGTQNIFGKYIHVPKALSLLASMQGWTKAPFAYHVYYEAFWKVHSEVHGIYNWLLAYGVQYISKDV